MKECAMFSNSYLAAVSIYAGLNLVMVVGGAVLFYKWTRHSKKLEEQLDEIFEQLDS
jgi:type II secretory pathway component PulL